MKRAEPSTPTMPVLLAAAAERRTPARLRARGLSIPIGNATAITSPIMNDPLGSILGRSAATAN